MHLHGSTGGGFKVLRVAILFKLAKNEIFKILTPRNAIKSIYIEKKKVDKNEINRISSIFLLWAFLLLIGGIITSLLSNFNATASISGMFSALGNIGPSYIPVNEFPKLDPIIKYTYIFGMLAGRLEIFPIILLFNKNAWIK